MTVPIGDALISTVDSTFAAETCEELFTPSSPHIDLSLNGVEMISNSSASHHELRKLGQRISLIVNATKRCGGTCSQSGIRSSNLVFHFDKSGGSIGFKG